MNFSNIQDLNVETLQHIYDMHVILPEWDLLRKFERANLHVRLNQDYEAYDSRKKKYGNITLKQLLR